METSFRHALTVLAAAGISVTAHAQPAPAGPAYPTKPIRFVVPFPPGGTTEIQARKLAEMLRQRVGQPVIIDNRSGANGSIGMAIVSKAPADGYTIILANVGNWAVHPHLYKLDYDVVKDFAPIIHVATSPGLVVVHPGVAAKSVQDLVALARQKPGQLNYGSNGAGGFSHLAGELFAAMTKVKLTHVPYKGAAPVLTDLMGGHIQLSFNSVVPLLPHVKSGKLRALAATGATRISLLPDLPTVAEAGVPGYEAATWSAIAAPAGTPRGIVQRLNKELAAILQSPEMVESARAEGSVINGGTPEQFRDFLKAELTKYGRLVKEAGIRVEAGG
ncbi:MAG TPA: tripartite tricarboxylate transporter substrate binding protein [Burkholderiales bacterium]|nr:tripartite tricarboxylate transporter substrate binding protein [Burkholderiales bacterium]